MSSTDTQTEVDRLSDELAANHARLTAADKATPRPWRDDGSMISGDYQTRMLVGGEDGDHPTIFIESQCTTADEIEQFEANFDLIRRSVNQSAAVEGLVTAARSAVGLMGYLHWNSDPSGRRDKAEAYRQLSDAIAAVEQLKGKQ